MARGAWTRRADGEVEARAPIAGGPNDAAVSGLWREVTSRGGVDDDDTVVAEKVWLVRQTISDMLRRGLASRRSVVL